MSQQNNVPVTITDIVKPELPTLTALLSLSSNESADNIQTLAIQELNYLEQQAALKPALLNCDKSSIILAVKNVMRKNLSLDPNAGLVYVKTRNLNVGTYEKPIWKTVMEVQETANGLLSYNRQLGRILDFTNPKIKEDSNGKTIGVSMEILKPSPLGSRWEEYSFNEGDFLRWRRASHKENKKGYKPNTGKQVPNDEDAVLNYANPNYTSWKNGLDPEFARAKCIRHSLKKLGSNPNEVIIVSKSSKEITVIDKRIADMEADEEMQEFTPVEEINTTINEETKPGQPNIAGYNPNDL